MSGRFSDRSVLLSVCGQCMSLIVDRTHLVQASGKLVPQKKLYARSKPDSNFVCLTFSNFNLNRSNKKILDFRDSSSLFRFSFSGRNFKISHVSASKTFYLVLCLSQSFSPLAIQTFLIEVERAKAWARRPRS